MKTIYKICAVVITTSLMNTSCSLDEYNPGGVTPETVYTTPEGYETLINQSYSNLRAMCYGREDMMFFNETGTDLWNIVNNKNYLQQINKYQDLSSSVGAIKNVWERFYVPINLCNSAIERIDFAGYSDESLKKAKVAEAYFLRAFIYWHIVEQYGNVSLVTKETTTPVMVAYRSPVSDFYKLIFEDLKFAKEYLPINQATGENGRATKKAAHSLLARMYLTYASYLRYYENNKVESDKYYLLAKITADEVIQAASTYNVKLYDSYEDIFNPANNKTNKEALYVVSHSYNPALEVNSSNPNRLFCWFQAQYSNQPGMTQTLIYGRDNSRHLQPSKYLLELFDETIDARYNASFQEVWLCNDATKNVWNKNWLEVYSKDQSIIKVDSPVAIKGVGDTAIVFTKQHVKDKAKRQYAVFDMSDMYNTDGTFAHISGQKNFFPTLRKFMDPYRASASSQAGGMDVILIRLSEMYLIAAEAEFHLNNEDSAIKYINVLRARAAIKTPVDKTEQMKVTSADIGSAAIGNIPGHLNFILDERARELCGEHLRWFDLKRTKQLENRLGASAPIAGNPNIVLFDKAKHYVRPIPLAFLQALENEVEFGQNPGY